ncbi:MAG: hypothetical protein AMJ79_12605 [Phycisphaerae bacterium SM23_30]|jgi:hypothetical protein|nr:MAG: hypothetical protein AMJ79_12605 [Phycisphaerae bacterium SM23_30]
MFMPRFRFQSSFVENLHENACDVTDESNDKKQFEPMLEQAQENVCQDKKIKSALANSSYYSESNVGFAFV